MKPFTMPPIVGVDPHLNRNGTLFTPEQARAVPPSTTGFSKDAGIEFRRDIQSRGTRLVEDQERQARQAPHQADDHTFYGLAPARG